MLHLETGKYALFIWPAYGLTVLAFAGMIVSSLGFARRWRRKAQDQAGRRDETSP